MPATDPLISTAMRGFSGDSESTAAAGRLLETLRSHQPPQETAAIQRWDAHDGKTRRLSWRAVFYSTAALVSVLILTAGAPEAYRYAGIYGISRDGPDPLDPASFSEHGRLLLKLSDTGQSPNELEKALWDSAPENPAYFAEYCGGFFRENGRLPADFLEQARRIDPQNAFFPYRAATLEAKDAAFSPPDVAPGWVIADEGKIDRTIALIQQGGKLTDYRAFTVQMTRERIPLLPQRDPVEYHQSLTALSYVTSNFFSYSKSIAQAIAAKAWLCGERGDAPGLIFLIHDVDAYLRHLSHAEAGFIIEDHMIERFANLALDNLSASATKLSLTREAAELQGQLDRLKQLEIDRETESFQIDGDESYHKVGRLQSGIGYHYALLPPVVTDSEVKPGRMIDHEFITQLCTFAAAGLLGIMAGAVALFRFRVPKLIRELALRVDLLLRPLDWTLLFLSGILPLCYLLAITRATPLGGLGRNIGGWLIELPFDGEIFLPLAQFAAATVMMLILPILVARWRLGKRARFFGFGSSVPGWIALASAAALIPVLGWATTTASDTGLKISFALAVIPAGWLVMTVLWALILGGSQLLHLCTLSRLLVPTYVAVAVLLLLATPYFSWSRTQWFQQDTLNRLDVKYPSLSKFEYQLSLAARKEIREALGYDTP